MNLPAASTHSNVNSNETDILNQILLSVSQNMSQQPIKKPLKPCNIFILLKTKTPVENNHQSSNFSSFNDFEVPSSCSQMNINFKNLAHFSIFEDFGELTISDEKKCTSWLLCNGFVKGFNDVLIKNKSIWD